MTAFTFGVAGGMSPAHSHSTSSTLSDISKRLKSIEEDLGLKSGKVNFDSYPVLTKKHTSLMAKNLTPEIYEALKERKTEDGYTLDQAIQTGVDTPHLGVGIVAGDEQSYQTFKEIMDPVIEGWHGYKPSDKHSSDMDASKIKNGAVPDEYVISTRIRSGRSVRGLALYVVVLCILMGNVIM